MDPAVAPYSKLILLEGNTDAEATDYARCGCLPFHAELVSVDTNGRRCRRLQAGTRFDGTTRRPEGDRDPRSVGKQQIYPGTVRDYWVYVPAQYDGKTPACVMVFQDGRSYVDKKGPFRVPIVFDNLIHKGEMPVTIGIFINPGVFPSASARQMPRSNRSVEYDTVSDQYARFLWRRSCRNSKKNIDSPLIRRGGQFAGSAREAFVRGRSAWQKPDQFREVLTHVGSFTNIRGGYVYPSLIRETPPKPIRIFLQDGSHDLDNKFGNWPLANQEMAAALKFAHYDYKFVFGEGGHNGKQGGAILPDSLRWLWRDYKPKS